MTNEKKKHIAEQVSDLALELSGEASKPLSNISTKRIRLYCDHKIMSDKEVMHTLEGLKMEAINLGSFAHAFAGKVKAIMDSNPDEPDLPLMPEDLQDDNPIDEGEH